MTQFTALVKQQEPERAVHELRQKLLVDFDVEEISAPQPNEVMIVFATLDSAETKVVLALNQWFVRDHGAAPFPLGTLLWWQTR